MKCDIIIPVWNQLEYTKQLVDSIFKNTTFKDYKFIFIDNGSQDGTLEYLKTLKNTTIIKNSENIGVAPAWNQGLSLSTATYKVIMNNDIMVAPGWLSNMIYTMENKNIKIACPYSTEGELPAAFPNNYTPVDTVKASDRLFGFCFCVHKEAVEAIGEFDERFKMAWYEDRDYDSRARRLKIDPYLISGSYIHHFGSKTLQHLVSKEQYIENNRVYYDEKHNKAKLNIPMEADFNGENIAYKISSPSNFPPPPPESEVLHGSFRMYKEIPEWAKNNPSFFIEKLELEIEKEEVPQQEVSNLKHIQHIKDNAEVIETESVIIPSPVRNKKEIKKKSSKKKVIKSEKNKTEEETEFKCEWCNRSFKSTRGLKIHQRLCKSRPAY